MYLFLTIPYYRSSKRIQSVEAILTNSLESTQTKLKYHLRLLTEPVFTHGPETSYKYIRLLFDITLTHTTSAHHQVIRPCSPPPCLTLVFLLSLLHLFSKPMSNALTGSPPRSLPPTTNFPMSFLLSNTATIRSVFETGLFCSKHVCWFTTFLCVLRLKCIDNFCV